MAEASADELRDMGRPTRDSGPYDDPGADDDEAPAAARLH